jgi:hypothetical protein
VAQNLLLDAIHHRASRLPVLDGRAPEPAQEEGRPDRDRRQPRGACRWQPRAGSGLAEHRQHPRCGSRGCDLFDIEELEDEYPADEFANLFMCEFVDDSLSAFKFNDLIACGCDSLVEWEDFNPKPRGPMAPARSGPDTTRRKARPATTPRW